MRRVGNRRRSAWARGVACLLGLACGNGDDAASPLFEEEQTPAEPVVTPLPPEDEEEMVAMPAAPETPAPPPVAEVEPERGCRPARGVSGAPKTISEAIILINTLPKPVTLECFVEALDRPLTLYMTSSGDSLQPSPGERSPRTFIINENLVMSIVFDGRARDTLEFGYRAELSRSIKAELLFPITREVSEETLFDRVLVTEGTTQCGACHVSESHEEFPGFPAGVYASDVIVPFDMDEVTLDTMMAETAGCDAAAEPFRCGLLSALFDNGEVVRGELPVPVQE